MKEFLTWLVIVLGLSLAVVFLLTVTNVFKTVGVFHAAALCFGAAVLVRTFAGMRTITK
jgi:hypothetical protein